MDKNEETGHLIFTAILQDEEVTATPRHRRRRKGNSESAKEKYLHNPKIDSLGLQLIYASDEEATRLCQEICFEIYGARKREIAKLARQYSGISGWVDEEDLKQDAYVAILKTLLAYKNSSDVNMKLSTFQYWKVENEFQTANKAMDSFVEVIGPDGSLYKQMLYNEWLAKKKKLLEKGYTNTFVRPQQLSALFPNTGGPDDNISADMQETDEPIPECTDSLDENEPIRQDKDFRLYQIDVLYKKSRHRDIESSEGKHILQKICELYQAHLVALALCPDDPPEMLQEMMRLEIIASWTSYRKGMAPGDRYSLHLEQQVRKKLPELVVRVSKATGRTHRHSNS